MNLRSRLFNASLAIMAGLTGGLYLTLSIAGAELGPSEGHSATGEGDSGSALQCGR